MRGTLNIERKKVFMHRDRAPFVKCDESSRVTVWKYALHLFHDLALLAGEGGAPVTVDSKLLIPCASYVAELNKR